MRTIHRRVVLVWLVLWFGAIARAPATEIVLKDNRVFNGKIAPLTSMAETPLARNRDALRPILMLDDGLRRIFVPKSAVREPPKQPQNQLPETFKIRQGAKHNGMTISSVGPPLNLQNFDEFGRRTYPILTTRGEVPVIQALTEITPQWCKVEALSHVWDMRLATSSIPPDVLQKILWNQVNREKEEDYKKVARFYVQSERYGEARQALDALLAAFPDKPELKEQLKPSLQGITQQAARQLLMELRLRRDSGQHKMVSETLKDFPTEDVPGEILQGARQMSQEYDARAARLRELGDQLKTLSSRLDDAEQRDRVQPILDEIASEAGPYTLDRMAAFLQSANSQETPDAEKLSLAISGWLLGAESAVTRLDRTVSVQKVREFLRQYLRAATDADREAAYDSIRREYAGDPATVAALAAHMKPPLDPPPPTDGKPGFFMLETPGLADGPAVTYFVQLPPEYDPFRRYPTIVTLNCKLNSAEEQINWWAGEWRDGQRPGQSARYGYIVIAPVWMTAEQSQYGYSAREHVAVLYSLRDAFRRFSIDTDRVYLSGHSCGGDAAWDIGLAHPDLWAGVIPIVAKSDRYCNHYWENARYVPFYVISGEMDGDKFAKNAADVDRYLKRGFDTTVVQFIGRGHDDFYDEILRLFDWMGRFHRNPFPRDFECVTMRTWDNSFWYVEMQGLPQKSTIDPGDWPPPASVPAARVHGTITDRNGVSVRAGSARATVWLSPEMLDFKQRASIQVNGKRLGSSDQIIEPDLLTLLEDIRTRGDRQHPFWAKLEGTTGRVLGK